MIHHPTLALAFRPFFLSASLFAVLSMLAWLAQLQGWTNQFTLSGSSILWHSHEMIYGYAMAVIAGFLLTAARNWTGIQTIQHAPLLGLWALWAIARVGILVGMTDVALLFDLAFNLGLVLAFSHPIIRAGQWKQIGILSKLLLLLIGNGLFTLGHRGEFDNGQAWGIGIGLYLCLAMVLVLARRVIPFFISKIAITQVRNYRWLDIANLLIFTLFATQMTFLPNHASQSLLAVTLLMLNSIRLFGWYHACIWRTPMLWVLYLAYAAITFGFALSALAAQLPLAGTLSTHAFSIGGIGLMSVGMMARVSRGHTGRAVNQPPPLVSLIFALVLAAFLLRVVLPLLFPATYVASVPVSQLSWIVAFSLLSYVYLPIWTRPRIDGKAG